MTVVQGTRESGHAQTLAGPRVSLRPFTEADATPQYLGWLNDPEVTRYLEVGKQPVTLAHVQTYVARFQRRTADRLFAIIDRASGRHIGNVTLNHVDRRLGTADTGLMIGDKAFWGRGYAYEVWSLLLDDAFKTLRLRTIHAGAVVGHHPSIQTLRKLGFRLERTIHRDGPGFSWDVHQFSLRSEEFRPAARQ